MRYMDDVIFVKESGESVYDPYTGRWIEAKPDEIVSTVNVTDLGTNRSVELFGELRKGAKVIRLQPLFVLPEWDYVLINNAKYVATTTREALGRKTLIVEEVF